MKNQPKIKFYNASTSEMHEILTKLLKMKNNFTQTDTELQKLYSHLLTKYYREYNIFACSGILFNRESQEEEILL